MHSTSFIINITLKECCIVASILQTRLIVAIAGILGNLSATVTVTVDVHNVLIDIYIIQCGFWCIDHEMKPDTILPY